MDLECDWAAFSFGSRRDRSATSDWPLASTASVEPTDIGPRLNRGCTPRIAGSPGFASTSRTCRYVPAQRLALSRSHSASSLRNAKVRQMLRCRRTSGTHAAAKCWFCRPRLYPSNGELSGGFRSGTYPVVPSVSRGNSNGPMGPCSLR
jgi:hypothetical protein